MNEAAHHLDAGRSTPERTAHSAYLNSPELGRQLRGIARRVCQRTGRPELSEDALQEAWLACAESVPKYGASRGASLAQYIRSRAYWAVLHYCRANSGAFTIPERMWRARNPSGDDDLSPAIYTHSLQEPATDEDDDTCSDRLGRVSASETIGGVHLPRCTGEDGIWRHMEHQRLAELMDRLDPRERHIMGRYGEGYECAAIGRELGVSRQRVHQVLRRACSKIRAWWYARPAA